jgi:hypothetical protein
MFNFRETNGRPTKGEKPVPSQIDKETVPLLKMLLDMENEPVFNVFYGGIGDFRHCIRTLASLRQELEYRLRAQDVTEEQVARLKVRITVCDIDPYVANAMFCHALLCSTFSTLLCSVVLYSVQLGSTRVSTRARTPPPLLNSHVL